MLAELTNIPTHTLIEMLFVTMMGTVALTATDIAEIRTNPMRVEKETRGPTLDIGGC